MGKSDGWMWTTSLWSYLLWFSLFRLCYLFWNPFVPSGPLGVLITSTPLGGGEGNTPAAVAPLGSRVKTFRSLPLALLSLCVFLVLPLFWLSLRLFAWSLSWSRLRLEKKLDHASFELYLSCINYMSFGWLTVRYLLHTPHWQSKIR